MTSAPGLPAGWIDDVHRFWFGLAPEAWFRADPGLDDEIRHRFGALHRLLADARLLPNSPREALSAVIVLDQFPRNMFRGRAEAFATDAEALRIGQDAIAAGLDRHLDTRERQFLYMPFQHSEDLAIQRRSVELFKRLGLPDAGEYAERHQDVIERFGRFPFRNAALGRASTPEELDYMRTAQPF